MKQLVIHFSRDHKAGDYTRIRKLQIDISAILKSQIYEVKIIKITDLYRIIMERSSEKKLSPANFKIVLPILLPGIRRVFVRRLNALISCLAGACISFFISPDICIGETHSSYPAISAVKKITKGCHVCVDLHGAYPEETYYTHVSQSEIGSVVHLLDGYERKLLNCVDVVICQSEAMLKHLCAKHHVQENKFLVYQCGVDMVTFSRNEALGDIVRKRLDVKKDECVFVYLGGLHRWQLIDDVITIYAAITRKIKTSKLLIITNGDKQAVLNKATQQGVVIDSIRIVSVPHSEVPMYLSACDIGFLLREDTILNRVACPTKLGEYLACGLPVIVSSIGNTWDWTTGMIDQICIVDHTNADKAAQRIVDFLGSTAMRKISIQSSCRDLAQSKLSAQSDTNNLRAHFGDLT